MESNIVKSLKPEYEPVAVVWSDSISPDTVQYKKGKFGCILFLFAEASARGRVTGGSRETIACPGGRAALGFGVEFDKTSDLLDHHAALFSKGLSSAKNRAAYQAKMDSAPPAWKDMYLYGERRHLNAKLAKQWILYGLPHFDIPHEYVLFKPLSQTASDENIRAVIFPLTPVELSGLVTLTGSVMQGTDPVKVPQGADCNSITAFAYAEGESEFPRAVLGMLGVDGREVMKKRFKNDVMTLTLATPLFRRLEQEARDSVLTIPSWKKVAER